MEYVWGAIALGFADVYALPVVLGLIYKVLPASVTSNTPLPASPATLTAGLWSVAFRGAALAGTLFLLRMFVGSSKLEEA